MNELMYTGGPTIDCDNLYASGQMNYMILGGGHEKSTFNSLSVAPQHLKQTNRDQ
jgi:hypothetical protein